MVRNEIFPISINISIVECYVAMQRSATSEENRCLRVIGNMVELDGCSTT